MVPETLRRSGWLDQVQGRILTPKDTEITCLPGHGTLIDYAVYGEALTPFLGDLTTDHTTKWRPHKGLQLALRAEPREVRIRALKVPQDFPWPPELHKPGTPTPKSSDNNGRVLWERLNTQETRDTAAQTSLQQRLREQHIVPTSLIGDRLAGLFLMWARAVDKFHYEQLQPETPLTQHMGRYDDLPTFRMVSPTPPTMPAGAPAISPARCPNIDWWSRTILTLQTLHTLAKRKAAGAVVHFHLHRTEVWNSLRRLRSQAKTIPEGERAPIGHTRSTPSTSTPKSAPSTTPSHKPMGGIRRHSRSPTPPTESRSRDGC